MRVSNCFINPAWTVSQRQQAMRAAFGTSTVNTNQEPLQFNPVLDQLPVNATRLRRRDGRPFKLNKNVLRQIKMKDRYSLPLWFLTEQFQKGEDGNIYCFGSVFGYMLEDSIPKLYHDSLHCLEQTQRNVYILLDHLQFNNDFLFQHQNQSYLIKWINQIH